MTKALLGSIVVSLFLVGCHHSQRLARRDVVSTQKLIGLQFSKSEIDTMLPYLQDNRKGYDSMRKYKLSNDIAPAVLFSPKPSSFEWKKRDKQCEWQVKPIELPDNTHEIAFLPVTELAYLIKQKKITSTALTRIYLDRLKQFGDTLKTVVTITESLALQQAAQADEEIAQGKYRGLLHGIPYGIKDLFAVPGYKTTWGAEPYQQQVINAKAEVVQRLEDAGAVLVAKLTTGALARGDVWFGGKTKNPWDLKQGASGSSAGSASATAAGLVPFAIGTETLGSVLSPSARCGVTGLRPTFGAISRDGCMTLSWSMDKVGIIARSAQDCALVFHAIKGSNGKKLSDQALDYEFGFKPRPNLKDLKIGYFKKMFDRDTTVTRKIDSVALQVLRQLGAQLVEVEMPDSIPFDAFDIILRAEAGSFFDELVRSHQDRLMSEQDKGSRANSLRQARLISAVEYLQANRFRKVLIEKFNQIVSGFDLLIAPANGRNISLATNLTGHPAMAIPNGFDKKGKPTSITFIGNLYDEAPLLEAAYLFQQNTEWEERHPNLFYGHE
ncbi:MAG: amidase [Bacteroidota bacterium]|jgi:Asp-tRNA(Asn)/Glu-tRNA(Gln) amidotransferase A subunit family amidase|nr:amidase [Flammeovirgaceae bacterium]MCZ8070394.1 amidase [Cytophagales bacterium]